MSHQDTKSNQTRLNADCLKRALRWLLAGISWSAICLRDDCSWTPRLLAAAAMLWVWSDESTLVERFKSTRKIIDFLWPQQDRELAASYQAFMKLLRRWTPELALLLKSNLRQRMQTSLADCWTLSGYVAFAVDGSAIELPRTLSNEAVYSPTRKSKPKSKRSKKRAAKHDKKADSPQVWLTAMWHIGSELPWDWRSGPSDSSERAHLLEMIPDLPPNSLVTADAGFVGYEYLRALHDSGNKFVVRVGSNVNLLKKLGYARESGQTVYLWPDIHAKKNRPPLVLRLIMICGGKAPAYLVTNVLSKSRLSDKQVIDLYRSRWEIEVYYRSLKQTFACRKLRSKSADNARLEIEWSLYGLWAMTLYAQAQLRWEGPPPGRLSVAQTLRGFRRILRDYRHTSEKGRRLCQLLRAALIDEYERKNKTSRGYPAKKKEKPPGPPNIYVASKEQIKHARTFPRDPAAKGLTA